MDGFYFKICVLLWSYNFDYIGTISKSQWHKSNLTMTDSGSMSALELDHVQAKHRSLSLLTFGVPSQCSLPNHHAINSIGVWALHFLKYIQFQSHFPIEINTLPT